MFRLTRLLCVTLFVIGLAACTESQAVLEETIPLQVPRATIRDAVRDSALLPSGQPLFKHIDTNYAFVGNRFRGEGDYVAPDGAVQQGFMELSFTTNNGALQVAIADHNLQGLEAEAETIAAAVADGVTRAVEETLARDISAFVDVTGVSDNVLEISVTAPVDPDDRVVPLPLPEK